MKNNGYTLVELLAVIVILAIVSGIASIGIFALKDQIDKNIFEIKIDTIEKAAILWAEDNKILFCYPDSDKKETISISDLVGQGYLTNDAKCKTSSGEEYACIINNETGDDLSDNEIIVEFKDKKFVASLNIETSETNKLYQKIIINNADPKNPDANFEQAIESIENKGNPVFTETSTSDEGINSFAEDDGKTYYFRGAVQDNYVQFAGFMWRIIRIDKDNNIRLIYDDSIDYLNASAFNEFRDNKAYSGYMYELNELNGRSTDSKIKKELDDWYTSKLKSYEKYLSKGKYCMDRTVSSTDSSSYGSDYRLRETHKPSFDCNDKDVLKEYIGLISVDEVMLAGGKANDSNESYYLDADYQYWTISPSIFNNNSNVYSVLKEGGLNKTTRVTGIFYPRPVISIKSSVSYSSGDGTEANPYKIK